MIELAVYRLCVAPTSGLEKCRYLMKDKLTTKPMRPGYQTCVFFCGQSSNKAKKDFGENYCVLRIPDVINMDVLQICRISVLLSFFLLSHNSISTIRQTHMHMSQNCCFGKIVIAWRIKSYGRFVCQKLENGAKQNRTQYQIVYLQSIHPW